MGARWFWGVWLGCLTSSAPTPALPQRGREKYRKRSRGLQPVRGKYPGAGYRHHSFPLWGKAGMGAACDGSPLPTSSFPISLFSSP